MRSFKRLPKMNRGFTLVELMIVVAIIGVLAALAIYGVSKYLATTKTSEAKNTLGGIKRAVTTAFESDKQVGTLLAEGGSGAVAAKSLCLTATAVPSAAVPKGVKYQPVLAEGSDWTAGDLTAGWKCVGFTMSQPHYYQYGYTASNASAANGTFETVANGDLDGDGTSSQFRIQGAVVNGTLKTSDNVEVVANEFE
jgi:type IV pilus assembly protein PilA